MFQRRSLATLIGGVAIVSAGGLGAAGLGCGPSQEEYAAKVSEVASLKKQLDAEEAQNKKAKRELDQAAKSIAELKEKLAAAGVDVTNLTDNVEQQARALEDYRRRLEQIEQGKRRLKLLRSKIDALGNAGLRVTIRRNRIVIQLPGDVLFDPSKELLKKEGQELVVKVAQVIKGEAVLSARSFQVAGHSEALPSKGAGRFKDSWALSLLRAREVLALLIQPTDKGGGGLDPAKWSASGYGDTDPAGSDSKQANRCELVLLPSAEEMLDLEGVKE